MNNENNYDTIKRIEEVERKQLEKLAEKNRRWFEIMETIYLGKIEGKEIYRLAELDKKDNYTDILYKYFDENAQVKGIKNVRPDGAKQWIYLEEEWEQLRDEIDLNEVQLEEEIEQILARYGIFEEDKLITEIDLEQEINEKEEQEIDEDQEEKEEKGQDKKKYEQTRDYKDFEQEINTSVDVDNRGTTLAKGLGLEEYIKLLIVHPEKLSEIRDENGEYLERTTQTFAVLGVTEKDGKQVVEKIPENKLCYHRGYNEQSIRFDDDGQVEENTDVCQMFVNPSTKRGLIVDRSELEVKVFYSAGRDIEDNTQVAIRVKDSTVGLMKTDIQRNIDPYKGQYHQKDINEEMEQHSKDKGKINDDNGDGNKNTVSEHIHEIDKPSDQLVYDGEYTTVEKAAKNMGVPVYFFIRGYNHWAKELEGKDKIDLKSDVYDEIKAKWEEIKEKAPKKEQGGITPGENRRR